jgi:hypothetical protein
MYMFLTGLAATASANAGVWPTGHQPTIVVKGYQGQIGQKSRRSKG